MFKYFVFICVVAAVFAKPGLLAPSLSIAAAPAIVSAPSVGIVGAAPLAISSGLLSNGLISNGLVSNGLVANGLIANGDLISGGLVSSGLVHGGLVSGKILSGGLIH